MDFRTMCLIVSMICLILFCLTLGLMISRENKPAVDLNGMINGRVSLSAKNVQKSVQDKLKETSWYHTKCEQYQEQLTLLHNMDDTPEEIIKIKFLILFGGIIATILIQLIFNVFILTVIALCLTIYGFFMKDNMLKSALKKKLEEFDEQLPQFESSMLMSMQAGAGLQKAMAMAIRSMPDGLVKEEFQQLLLETETYTDNLALPYLNLSKRVQTKDCARFCNVVIFGLKNGNTMSEILENESAHMNQQILTRIREKGEKNSVKATAISSGLVFLPMIIIFIAPLMANSNM